MPLVADAESLAPSRNQTLVDMPTAVDRDHVETTLHEVNGTPVMPV